MHLNQKIREYSCDSIGKFLTLYRKLFRSSIQTEPVSLQPGLKYDLMVYAFFTEYRVLITPQSIKLGQIYFLFLESLDLGVRTGRPGAKRRHMCREPRWRGSRREGLPEHVRTHNDEGPKQTSEDDVHRGHLRRNLRGTNFALVLGSR